MIGGVWPPARFSVLGQILVEALACCKFGRTGCPAKCTAVSYVGYVDGDSASEGESKDSGLDIKRIEPNG